MKKKSVLITVITIGAVLFLSLCAMGGYQLWHYAQPKFHDVTVELGTDRISIAEFMTEYASGNKVSFVSDVSLIDMTKVGTTEITLRHGRKEETVILSVVDTTAPVVSFKPRQQVQLGYEPKPEDFIESVEDLSGWTASFLEPPVVPDNYADLTLTVVVTDDYGNSVSAECVLSYVWMRDEVTLEFGVELTKAHILFDAEKDGDKIAQEDLDRINAEGVGTYTITGGIDGNTAQCTVTVVDTTGPELELKDVTTYIGRAVGMNSFVVSATDLSGEVKLRLKTTLTFDKEGTQTVEIEAEDVYGNITTGTATLRVTADHDPPVISGLSAMTVQKHSSPDFLKGVSANDAYSGACEVTCDTSALNLDKAGVYYITYSAKDAAGNVGTARRKVEVLHDYEDTLELAKQIASTLSSNPEAIRDYVRNTIYYNTNWGGDDPVWYGFKNHWGNCYVHAMCFKALLDQKGIPNQLIWVKDKTHYWLLVSINGQWKHMDATPSSLHGRYSIMNDKQRYETLSGRDWDRTLWPACD